jgi:hypothetical protein
VKESHAATVATQCKFMKESQGSIPFTVHYIL